MNALEDDNHAARIHAALTCQHILEYHHIGYFENISEYRQIMAFRHRRSQIFRNIGKCWRVVIGANAGADALRNTRCNQCISLGTC